MLLGVLGNPEGGEVAAVTSALYRVTLPGLTWMPLSPWPPAGAQQLVTDLVWGGEERAGEGPLQSPGIR